MSDTIHNIPCAMLNAARLCVANKNYKIALHYVLIDADHREIIATDGKMLYYAWNLGMEGTGRALIRYAKLPVAADQATLTGDRLEGGRSLQLVDRYHDAYAYPDMRVALPAKTDVPDGTAFTHPFRARYLAQAERCFGKDTEIWLLPYQNRLILHPRNSNAFLLVMQLYGGGDGLSPPSTYYGIYGADNAPQREAA